MVELFETQVKYQQGSWDDFASYVWDKLNDEEGGGERPEPQGSDKPEEFNDTATNSEVASNVSADHVSSQPKLT